MLDGDSPYYDRVYPKTWPRETSCIILDSNY